MYKAKKDNIYCGKRTTCVILGFDSTNPIQVNFAEMQLAEKDAGQLDFLLQCTATFYLGSTEENIQKNAEGVAQMLITQKTMRARIFHDTYGREIKL
jgi:hypothetical protein